MAVNWYVDQGLQVLIDEWKRAHPGATVYTIGDASHASRDSEHNPEPQGSAPGADLGEVDAADFMESKGVTDAMLDELADGLVRSRDPRILYVIRNRRICSSVVEPWVWRPYGGSDPHTDHVHLSVNDKFDDNESDWKWEKMVARTLSYDTVTGKWPVLMMGDEDANLPGYNVVKRAQLMANYLENTLPAIDTDGVYGPLTARKLGKIFKSDGKKLGGPQLAQLFGLAV